MGWNTCGCSTIYTDAWGQPINGPGSGADGTPTTTDCSINWGVVAMMGVATVLALVVTSAK